MGPKASRRQIAAALLVVLSAVAGVFVTLAVTRAHVPDRIPLYSLFGWLTSDYAPSELVFFCVGMGVSIPLLAAMHQDDAEKGSFVQRLCTGQSLIIVCLWCAVAESALLGAWGADSFADAQKRWWTVLLVAALLLPWGVVIRKVFPPAEPVVVSSTPVPASSLALSSSERAYWAGSVDSRSRLALGVTVMALGLGLFAVWPPLVLASFIGLAIARGSRLQVTVDFQGLSWRRRWSQRRSQIDLELIASASTRVHETAWQAFRTYDRDGGDPEVTDVRVRPGPALSTRLHDGQTWTFSVDDAHEAADVLNALVARHRLAHGSGSEVVEATSPSDRFR